MLKLALVIMLALATRAEAFCGFFIDTGGASMFSDATQVVLMRDGTRTVLAMENDYAGPLQDFAIVIPVPTVLHAGDVRTLPKSLFEKVNAMTAPRLVEYAEMDPCYIPEGSSVDARSFAKHSSQTQDPTVVIESQFDVDEYKVVILSATDSTGLDHYLRDAHYKIPAGAGPLLRPYVEAGSKFFVAKVDPKKVHYEHGKAVLSPLRFFYDADDFVLPIRLGLANSHGTQDLIINIIADDQRYEVANYPNALIPTNLDVDPSVKLRFGEFYAALFDRTVQQHPGAVITEYSWSARSCDPCPGPRLGDEDFKLLGEEVLAPLPAPPPPSPPPGPGEIDIGPDVDLGPPQRELVITRLHVRYGKDGAAADLVFTKAPPITGGRETRGPDGKAASGAAPAERNAFQGRYIIRTPWNEPIDCDRPRRGMWGSPRGRSRRAVIGAATDSATAPRGSFALWNAVLDDVPEIGVHHGVPIAVPPVAAKAQGCGCRAADAPGSLLVVAALLLSRRRRDRLRSAHAAPHVSGHDGIGDDTRRIQGKTLLREGR